MKTNKPISVDCIAVHTKTCAREEGTISIYDTEDLVVQAVGVSPEKMYLAFALKGLQDILFICIFPTGEASVE